MPGIALIKDYTAILSAGFLDIILRGLSTLNILKALINLRLILEKSKVNIAKMTIVKSIIFHALLV